ncbi:retinol dehydrogenase 11 isoform X2 [Myxocyprinus asiaticus]|uniref:retinol dehydrogenase 11 isoform X2 n=1 Tax=Myxocyprinus asiaticus TaxID=70543 RepID=UPI002223D4C7|nr:retinol dehydrogenase 11 isoform X2 [Myxocyprinus asiaticus]
MTWEWSYIFSHPLWMLSTAILAMIVRAQRKGSWDPRACPVELKGKTAIVTGANTGIGKFIALDFARRGARVILACRSKARGTAALHEIRERSGNQNVHLRLLDTSSLASVRQFAAQILEEEKELHILVNNAGASGLPREITGEGFEITFATNHLGPFLLTNLLLGVTANSLHPGVAMTEVMRNYNFTLRFLFNLVGFFFFKSSEEAAVNTIYCAVSEEMEGITGKYFDSDCSLVLPSPPARDPALGVKEFEICERLTAKL